jgi:cytochrome P450
VLIANTHSVAMSHDLWENPSEYQPERFLKLVDEEYKIDKTSTDKLFAFGFGKRACIGEGLARDTIFLILTALIQKYQFILPENEPKPSLIPLMGFTAPPTHFNVKIAPRKT